MREVRKMQANYSKDITQLQKKINALVSSLKSVCHHIIAGNDFMYICI